MAHVQLGKEAGLVEQITVPVRPEDFRSVDTRVS